jgi:hypothetical protein
MKAEEQTRGHGDTETRRKELTLRKASPRLPFSLSPCPFFVLHTSSFILAFGHA